MFKSYFLTAELPQVSFGSVKRVRVSSYDARPDGCPQLCEQPVAALEWTRPTPAEAKAQGMEMSEYKRLAAETIQTLAALGRQIYNPGLCE